MIVFNEVTLVRWVSWCGVVWCVALVFTINCCSHCIEIGMLDFLCSKEPGQRDEWQWHLHTHTTHTRIHRWFVETVEDQQRTMHCNALIRPRSVAMNHRRVERVHRKSSIIHIHTHTAHTVERRKNNMPRQRSSSFNHEYIYLYHISQFLLLYQPDF